MSFGKSQKFLTGGTPKINPLGNSLISIVTVSIFTMPSPDNPSPTTALPEERPRVSRNETNLTVDTEYIHMLLELDTIHWSYNFLSSLAGWTLLAGYLVIPGTFVSLQNSESLQKGLRHGHSATSILNMVQNPPLIGIGCTCFGLGLVIMLLLFYRWRYNYIWVTNRIFL